MFLLELVSSSVKTIENYEVGFAVFAAAGGGAGGVAAAGAGGLF